MGKQRRILYLAVASLQVAASGKETMEGWVQVVGLAIAAEVVVAAAQAVL